MVQCLGQVYRQHHPYPKKIFWVIEYPKSILNKDLEVKIRVYAQASIPEYWVVNLKTMNLIVFRRLNSDGYQSHWHSALRNILQSLFALFFSYKAFQRFILYFAVKSQFSIKRDCWESHPAKAVRWSIFVDKSFCSINIVRNVGSQIMLTQGVLTPLAFPRRRNWSWTIIESLKGISIAHVQYRVRIIQNATIIGN